jgi:tRNA U34 5-carboxymethylaminomethyl modifying GTPase MnmE/TrmE
LENPILGEEKTIVSPIAVTTRDVVEARYNLGGIPLILLDTAGIHETQDVVEKIGIDRSYQALEKADIIFWLIILVCEMKKMIIFIRKSEGKIFFSLLIKLTSKKR